MGEDDADATNKEDAEEADKEEAIEAEAAIGAEEATREGVGCTEEGVRVEDCPIEEDSVVA